MIRIREENGGDGTVKRIYLNMENHHELVFDSYPVIIKPRIFDHSSYEAFVKEKINKP